VVTEQHLNLLGTIVSLVEKDLDCPAERLDADFGFDQPGSTGRPFDPIKICRQGQNSGTHFQKLAI
jgi:hypothetical protein